MKQILIRGGKAEVREMPVPTCGPREILVETAYSLISAGTESATLESSAPPPSGTLWSRRAKKAGEVARMVRDRGPQGALDASRARLEGPSFVTGYSLAGTVREVGAEVDDIVPGQRVACAGASSAHHAEVVAVPRMLATPVPEGLGLDDAAFVTLGAIAMQGVRQAELRLGESALVLGLGLIGQLTVSLLAASGCRVIGADLDPARVELARGLGLTDGVVVGEDSLETAAQQLSAGRGVDAVLLTAGTASSEPIRQAMRLVRKRGRVVVVGAVGLELEREPFYVREAELRISCSYGPGRYDADYEERGQDYPYGYVRWTENRNMESFLELVARGQVPVAPLVNLRLPLERAGEAFAALGGEGERPLGVLLEYPDSAGAPPERRIEVVPQRREGKLGVALVGPGSFAQAVHVPNLAALGGVAALRTVVGRTANAAREAARKAGAEGAATSFDEVLGDPAVDVVLIATRHDQHAEQACRALEAGKAVFLEKPAALSFEELTRLEQALAAHPRPFTIGFNRRFAPDLVPLAARLAKRRGPVVLDYRVNAGKLPRDHWALDERGGGRLIGEGCHMLDLLRHLVGAPVVAWRVLPLAPPPGRDDLPLGDNIAVSLRYADGSLATLSYTSLGDAALGKERIEAHWDGVSAVMDDFRSLAFGGDAPARRMAPAKGHRALLEAFLEHAAGRAEAPIPVEECLETSRLVLELAAAARGAEPDAER